MYTALWIVLGCGGSGTPTADPVPPDLVAAPAPAVPAPAQPEPPIPARELLPDGAACLTGEVCASGLCEGEGCGDDQPGTCVGSMRRCTRDLRPYCGCDGVTFHGSGTCPNRRFSARGPCGGSPGVIEP